MTGFPGPEDRTTIIGSTGSGKTVFGMWLLSTCKSLDWKNRPVIIFDFKGDKMVRALMADGSAEEIDITKRPPRKAGLYVVRPLPDQVHQVDVFLRQVWMQEETGLFIDEGYELRKSNGFLAILTQGRSKQIPCIMNLQRPVYAPRFCFTEAQYYAIFYQNDKRDVKTVQEFVNADVSRFRGPYHAMWYDVGANAGRGRATIFKPVPDTPQILDTFYVGRKKALKKRVV